MQKTKHEINLENWEFIRNLTKEEKSGKDNKNRTSKGWYKCRRCGEIKPIQNGNFKKSLTICSCQKTINLKEKENKELNESRWSFVSLLTEEECKEVDRAYGNYRGWYECKTCGQQKHSSRADFNRYKMVCSNGCHGSLKNLNEVIKGVDDLATTHPHLLIYLVDKEIAKMIKLGSGKLIQMKCPICGLEKNMKPYVLYKQGFGCSNCSDGVSYPEKFIANLLKSLGIAFAKEYSLDNKKTKYDFYISSMNLIIETHGIQHYERSMGGRTVEEEKANDKYKHELALSKGIKHYIVLDCRHSEMEWIKQSILDSELSTLFNLQEIDWITIARQSEKSLIKEIADYYNEYGGLLKEVASHFNIGTTSASRYLKKATKLGFCNWKPTPNGQAWVKPIIAIKDEEIYIIKNSLSDLSKELNYDLATIGNLANGKGKNGHTLNSKKLGGKFTFYYLNSEDWEKDKSRYNDPQGLLNKTA